MPMPVTIEPTDVPDVLIVRTGCARDDRGYFSESYSRRMWAEAGFTKDFVQDNVSFSAKGTLRGMHYQIHPEAMGKLVRCLRGSIFDVAVDLRDGSPTFGKWIGQELSEENQLSFWVPVGFAHGFLALEDDTLVHYKCTAHHAPEHERALNYNCPDVGIQWPFEPTRITDKDRDAPTLSAAEFNFTHKGFGV